MRTLSFACSPRALKQLVEHRRGESDLVKRDGKWFLVATIDFPEPEVFEPLDWVGADRGIVNLATTSDGDHQQGRRLGGYRRWQARKRAELQAENTRSATGRGNRRSRGCFCCRCGFAGPADEVAAVNVRARARRAWAFLTKPAPHPA